MTYWNKIGLKIPHTPPYGKGVVQKESTPANCLLNLFLLGLESRRILLSLMVLVAVMYTNSSHANSQQCLMVFVGGCADDQTEFMKDLWKRVNNGVYSEFRHCQSEYAAYSGSNKITKLIQSFRKVSPRGSVTIVGHSLGGGTALSFAQRGADHVVTLDAYYPLTDCESKLEILTDAMRNILPGKNNPFRSTSASSTAFWTFVASGYPESCPGSIKKGKSQLRLAKYFGSGPIRADDRELSIKPNQAYSCNNCHHCDVIKMFEMARRKIGTRLRNR